MDINNALKIFEITDLDGVDNDYLKFLYKNQAKKKHPDRNGGDPKEFVKLKEAYLTLQKKVIENSTNGRKSRVLANLTKEELLRRYYDDTAKLQFQINFLQEQAEETLQETKIQVEEIIKNFENKKEITQNEIRQSIEKMREDFNKSLIKKFSFFLPSVKDQFWQKCNELIKENSKRQTELDMEFYKTLLNIYGETLNSISEIINQDNTGITN